ncbi:signaling protein [Bordetella trematum]|uniref:diguanylate cyclase n=1 Tax=Bordetella trematum TaxID=123899 RepID=A0A157PWB2_9BORD|nr:GGDEF domain-containing protein [Bordetella trematum]SAI37626.1 signaling protein [Bordetella trematum]SAI55549.1 signaling protein [Bordetella trematum]SAI66376.1 signaling protein [Bordetella trematum]SUV96634.1 signaling protein [Bordetella trematum]
MHRIPQRTRGSAHALRRQVRDLRAENRLLRRLAVTDELTGVFNRRYFSSRLHDAMTLPQREMGIALCIFDLDNFKSVNDRLGHAAGDRLLQAVASAVKRQLRRAGDCLCRLGGDEFAAIYSASSPQKALQQAEVLLAAIRGLGHVESLHGRLAVSATFGLVWLPPGEQLDWQRAYGCADYALYNAKQAGKGGITLLDAMQVPA